MVEYEMQEYMLGTVGKISEVSQRIFPRIGIC